MFSLNNSILLRGINTTQLMQNSIRVKKIFKIKLSSIITSYGFDFAIKLSGHHSCKLWKIHLCFKLMFKQVYLSASSKIIHNC